MDTASALGIVNSVLGIIAAVCTIGYTIWLIVKRFSVKQTTSPTAPRPPNSGSSPSTASPPLGQPADVKPRSQDRSWNRSSSPNWPTTTPPGGSIQVPTRRMGIKHPVLAIFSTLATLALLAQIATEFLQDSLPTSTRFDWTEGLPILAILLCCGIAGRITKTTEVNLAWKYGKNWAWMNADYKSARAWLAVFTGMAFVIVFGLLLLVADKGIWFMDILAQRILGYSLILIVAGINIYFAITGSRETPT